MASNSLPRTDVAKAEPAEPSSEELLRRVDQALDAPSTPSTEQEPLGLDPDQITPNGKRLRDCTKREVKQIAAFWAAVAAEVGPDRVGDRMTEARLQELFEAAGRDLA